MVLYIYIIRKQNCIEKKDSRWWLAGSISQPPTQLGPCGSYWTKYVSRCCRRRKHATVEKLGGGLVEKDDGERRVFGRTLSAATGANDRNDSTWADFSIFCFCSFLLSFFPPSPTSPSAPGAAHDGAPAHNTNPRGLPLARSLSTRRLVRFTRRDVVHQRLLGLPLGGPGLPVRCGRPEWLPGRHVAGHERLPVRRRRGGLCHHRRRVHRGRRRGGPAEHLGMFSSWEDFPGCIYSNADGIVQQPP